MTGSRTCGPWPEPSSSTRSPPVASASAIPRPGPVIASPVPWITSTGQRTRSHSSRTSASPSSSISSAAMSVSGVVSRPQPTQSSIGFVECGSVNICEKKNSRKPG